MFVCVLGLGGTPNKRARRFRVVLRFAPHAGRRSTVSFWYEATRTAFTVGSSPNISSGFCAAQLTHAAAARRGAAHCVRLRPPEGSTPGYSRAL